MNEPTLVERLRAARASCPGGEYAAAIGMIGVAAHATRGAAAALAWIREVLAAIDEIEAEPPPVEVGGPES